MLLRIPGKKVLLHATISKKKHITFLLFFKMSSDASESESELEKDGKEKLKENEGFRLDFKLEF